MKRILDTVPLLCVSILSTWLMASSAYGNEACTDAFAKASKSRIKQTSDISTEEFREIAEIWTKIKDRYPPDRFVYVMIGRSPTPLLAYLRALGSKDVFELPLSGFRNHPVREQRDHFSAPLAYAEEMKLRQHFRRFAPNERQLGGRNIVLIDYSLFGTSLISARIYLLRYYRALRQSVDIHPLPMTGDAKDLWPELSSAFQISLTGGVLSERLTLSDYDEWSEFGPFRLTKDNAALTENPKFHELVDDFRGRLNGLEK